MAIPATNLFEYINEQARVADLNSKEWSDAGSSEVNSAYRAGMWYAYNDVRNRLPTNQVINTKIHETS